MNVMETPVRGVNCEATQHGVLYRNPKPHVRSEQAYFPSVVALDDRRLGATVVLGEAFEAPNLHVVYFESLDGGASWQRKSTVTEPPADGSFSTVGRLSVFPDGSLVAVVGRHKRSAFDEGLTDGKTLGFMPMVLETYRSTDYGKTWQDAKKIPIPFPNVALEVCSPFTVINDTQILWPTSTWPLAGQSVSVEKFRTGALMSTDGGRTWPRWIDIYPNDRYIYWESKVIPLQDQRLLSVAWVHDLEKGCDLPNHYALGNADGTQWEAPQSMGILGQTLSCLALSDGRIISVYRRVDKPGLWALVSTLEELKWTNHRHTLLWGFASGASENPDEIGQHFATLKFGAPCMVELSGNQILIAFWAVVDGVSQINTITFPVD